MIKPSTIESPAVPPAGTGARDAGQAAPAPLPESSVAQALSSSVPQFLAGVERLTRAIEAARKQPTAQGERLLAHDEVAEVLGLSRATLYRLMPRLRARGLKAVTIPAANPRQCGTRNAECGVNGDGQARRKTGRPASIQRFTASSLARLIQRAAEKEEALC